MVHLLRKSLLLGGAMSKTAKSEFFTTCRNPNVIGMGLSLHTTESRFHDTRRWARGLQWHDACRFMPHPEDFRLGSAVRLSAPGRCDRLASSIRSTVLLARAKAGSASCCVIILLRSAATANGRLSAFVDTRTQFTLQSRAITNNHFGASPCPTSPAS